MLTGDIVLMTDEEIDRDVASLAEWLATWGSAETVPIATASLAGLLNAFARVRAERDEARRRLGNRPPPATRPRGAPSVLLPNPPKERGGH